MRTTELTPHFVVIMSQGEMHHAGLITPTESLGAVWLVVRRWLARPRLAEPAAVYAAQLPIDHVALYLQGQGQLCVMRIEKMSRRPRSWNDISTNVVGMSTISPPITAWEKRVVTEPFRMPRVSVDHRVFVSEHGRVVVPAVPA